MMSDTIGWRTMDEISNYRKLALIWLILVLVAGYVFFTLPDPLVVNYVPPFYYTPLRFIALLFFENRPSSYIMWFISITWVEITEDSEWR